MRWEEKLSPAVNARRRLPAMLERYCAFGSRLFEGGAASAAELHRLRLRTKRMRYTLELFRPCYGPGLEQRLALLRGLQGSLGEIQDGAAAERLIHPHIAARSRYRAPVRRLLDARAAAARKKLRAQWRTAFEGAHALPWWTDYLRRARPPR